jgi:RsiW-degrading membrane proteinase PrsW (M82 family)
MKFIRHRWFQVLVGGILLFLATEQALRLTGNPNLFPTILLIGSFVIPIAFVTYMYESERRQDLETHAESPIAQVAMCFFIGGAVGIVVAGVLEFETLRNLSIFGLVGVGLIEEAAKLLFPVAIFIRGRYRSEIDGVMFGVASGMGFASLETMGYGLISFVQSAGNINVLEQVLLIRGLLSPVGHAAWTGLFCAVLWRERIRNRHGLSNLVVIGTFILVVVFHILWDLSNSLSGATIANLVFALLGNLGIAAASLTLLILRLRESRRFAGELSPK